MAQSNGELTTDDVIFNIEDYVGGNIEGVEHIDRMGFTVFLRDQLERYRKQHELEARIDEWDYIHETLHAAFMDAVSYSTEVMKERIDELRAEKEQS